MTTCSSSRWGMPLVPCQCDEAVNQWKTWERKCTSVPWGPGPRGGQRLHGDQADIGHTRNGDREDGSDDNLGAEVALQAVEDELAQAALADEGRHSDEADRGDDGEPCQHQVLVESVDDRPGVPGHPVPSHPRLTRHRQHGRGEHRARVPSPNMLRLQAVSKRYGSRWAVEALSLEVGDGEVAVLIGPSGCGKSTTLKMINRLVEPTSGRVYLDGEDVTDVDPVRLRRRMGYVIQHIGLFPHQTVAGNVATVPHLLGWDRKRVRVRVDELLDLVGL